MAKDDELAWSHRDGEEDALPDTCDRRVATFRLGSLSPFRHCGVLLFALRIPSI